VKHLDCINSNHWLREFPIVQPEIGAFPEIVEVTKGGVTFSPNNADALAKKFEEVLSAPNKIIEMSENGRKAVETLFNTDVLTNDMINIYKQII
jgi:glycosyltransferase involved in cell wall biosynthesis